MGAVAERTAPGARRYDVDWLRVLAFSAVFFYHCGRFFDESDWHIKNGATSALVSTLKSIFDLWGMPLIFVISGASIYFALRPGGAGRFLRERALRLLAPLAIGILALAPPQTYLERLTHGEFQGSFLAFLPFYFRDWRVWGGNFAWTGVHLWYLENLFLFTLVLLPLFAALARPSGRRITEALGRLSALPGAIFLWALPLSLLLILIDPSGVMRPAPSETVNRLVVFPIFLLYGFLVFASEQIQQAIIRQRWIALVLALVLTLAASTATGALEAQPTFSLFASVMALGGLLIWASILTILGFGMRHLTANHRALTYANEAVLPFYILHQPVILLIGFFVVPLALPIGLKYLIIAPLAFGITLGLYEFGVRRINPVRRAFGLKARRPALPTAALTPQPAA